MKAKSKVVKEITPNKHLTDAANLIVKEFKTPANLLEFLTCSINWIEDYNDERAKEGQTEDSDTFFIQLLIAHLLQPWLEKGQRSIPDITNGLVEIQDTFGYDGYFERLTTILKGFTINVSEAPYVNEKMKKYLLSFSTMFEIGNLISDYEEEIKEQDKLSKAA